MGINENLISKREAEIARSKLPAIRCDECDNGLELDWKYCPYCGHWIEGSPSDDAEFGTKP